MTLDKVNPVGPIACRNLQVGQPAPLDRIGQIFLFELDELTNKPNRSGDNLIQLRTSTIKRLETSLKSPQTLLSENRVPNDVKTLSKLLQITESDVIKLLSYKLN